MSSIFPLLKLEYFLRFIFIFERQIYREADRSSSASSLLKWPQRPEPAELEPGAGSGLTWVQRRKDLSPPALPSHAICRDLDGKQSRKAQISVHIGSRHCRQRISLLCQGVSP